MNSELYYLVNPIYSKKIDDKFGIEKMENIVVCSKSEKKFYKKRIIQMTRDCMQGKVSNKLIEDSFMAYLKTCITHFKEEDRNELLQMEYINLIPDDNKNEIEDINIKEINSNLFKKDDVKKIEDCLPIQKRKIKKEDPKEYPKQKNVNIKDNKFKTKGVKAKKKNIDNI